MFALAHLSDPHLSPIPRPKLLELMGKRAVGYFNWRARRSVHHSPDFLGALVADMKARGFDHLAVTGDLVNLGLPGEYGLARRFLENLGPGERVSMVPGNHDAYVHGTALLHVDLWKEYIAGDEPAAKANISGAAFPYLRRRGNVAIIGLSTAIPTAPFLATGKLGKAQLMECEHLLKTMKEEHRFRVVLIHHPPAGRHSPHEVLTDAKAFCAVVARQGAELVLHGHKHKAMMQKITGADGAVNVIGVPSASNPGSIPERGGAYNVYRIGGKAGSWSCEMESYGFAPSGSGIAKVRSAKLI
ncbi:MAG: metallophosphoesterase [Xanthobacteraceae bacterium]|nr:metallophosphoesterase [Xanthobacteraceae bacterium]